MKEGITKWKLGWNVLLRALVFYLVLAALSFLLLPTKALLDFSVSWPSWARFAAITAGLIFALCLLPLIFYWTARMTGNLQGSDVDQFSRIELLERERNEFGEKDPWEVEDPAQGEPGGAGQPDNHLEKS